MSSKPEKEDLSGVFGAEAAPSKKGASGLLVGGRRRAPDPLDADGEDEARKKSKKLQFEDAADPRKSDKSKEKLLVSNPLDPLVLRDAYLVQKRDVFRKTDLESAKGQARLARQIDHIIRDAVLNRDWDVLVIGGGRRSAFVRRMLAQRLEMYSKNPEARAKLFGADADRAAARLQNMSVSQTPMSNRAVREFTRESAIAAARVRLGLPSDSQAQDVGKGAGVQVAPRPSPSLAR